MTTYLTQLMKDIEGTPIRTYWIHYFRENFRSEINDALQEAFRSSKLTKADLARKLDRRPEQITRWLSAPCNLESDTVSDIALALGLMPKVRFERVGNDQTNGQVHAFLAKFDQSSVKHCTSSRQFIVERSTHDTEVGQFSSSTNAPQKVIGQTSNKAYVKEVLAHA